MRSFSLLPAAHQIIKLEVAIAIVVVLIYLNLRGMRGVDRILAPIFIGFVVTHFAPDRLRHRKSTAPSSRQNWRAPSEATTDLAGQAGWFFVLAVFLRAYSLGGGTYTGIEAVSNNVNMLKEPRVRTGRVDDVPDGALAFHHGGRDHPALPVVGRRSVADTARHSTPSFSATSSTASGSPAMPALRC